MSGSSDNENTSLMADQSKGKKKQPDWSRFGLSREPVKGESSVTSSPSEIQDGSYQSLEEGKHNELYREDQVLRQVLENTEENSETSPAAEENSETSPAEKRDPELASPPPTALMMDDPPDIGPATAEVIPVPKKISHGTQASLRPLQRTRRIQVSLLSDSAVQTVSVGVQCDSLSDGISLKEAAGLAESSAEPEQLDSDFEEEEYRHEPDPDFDPLDEADDECEDQPHGYSLRTNAPPEEERNYLVSETSLAKLLQHCRDCDQLCETSVKYCKGALIGTASVCPNGHSTMWESQRSHHGMPWSNLLLAGSIVFSGLNASKCLRFLRHLRVPTISISTFNRIQSAYIVPAVLFTWDFHQAELLDRYRGRILTLGGDARCDSPGFSAKYGSYTLMDIQNGKVMDFQLVQSLSSQKPWYKANFFISEPVLFGTWDGVFTSCLINILGVVIFLRMGWIVGNAGILLTILMIFVTVFIVLIVALSAIGVCERCKMEGGGVYFLVSHVLGGRIGGCIGILYCFAQSVSCSLSVMGFGESIMRLMGEDDNPWIARGVAIALVLLLLGINIAGVKWVIRLQLILLFTLFFSAMDLVVGSFVHTDPEHGVEGYSEVNLRNNSSPDFLEGESFFSMMGLFFSTVTGILAGINMSGDLRDPFHNIPQGTLAALGVSTLLYVSFTLVLGATCVRNYLLDDVMIAEKVSIAGFLWLAGLYISSISSCMGSLYGPPRILQSIANENVMPIIRVLGQGRGPNKVPIFALILITLVTLLFIFVGDVNSLAPIVTTAFMMTYAAIDYAYFALAMSYDRRQEKELKYGPINKKKLSSGDIGNGCVGYGTYSAQTRPKDSFEKLASDLDSLFPERMTQRGQHHLVRQSNGNSNATTPEADFDATKQYISTENTTDQSDKSNLLPEKNLSGTDEDKKPPCDEIIKQPTSWYSFLCNRWLSLFGSLGCMIIMFSVQWAYALGELTAVLIIYIYIGQASPGYFPGIADFNMYEWIKGGLKRCCRGGGNVQEEIIVAPATPAMNLMAAQLTDDNEDFANRGRYHQSEIVRGENFDDYGSD